MLSTTYDYKLLQDLSKNELYFNNKGKVLLHPVLIYIQIVLICIQSTC